MAGTIKRRCCPHTQLPEGKTWEQAKAEGWRIAYTGDDTTPLYYCPEDAANQREMHSADSDRAQKELADELRQKYQKP